MTTVTLGTTNDEKPFEPGERIDFCGEQYTVVANYGNSGLVKDHGDGARFYWHYDGEVCRRVVETDQSTT